MNNGAATIAEGVQEVRDEAEARVAEDARRQLEEAEARVAEAQRVSQQITDAALQTELGRLIREAQNGVDQCRAELSAQGSKLDQALMRLTELAERLPTVTLVQPQRLPLTPPTSADQSEAISPETQAQPDGADADDQGAQATRNAQMARRRRKI